MNKKMLKMIKMQGYKKISFRLPDEQYYQVRELTKNFALVDEFFALLVEKSSEILKDYTIQTTWHKNTKLKVKRI